MTRLILRRILSTIPLLLGITFMTFFLMSLSGSNFWAQLKLTPNISEAYVTTMERTFGLDKPWYIQYFLWLKQMCMLDFGISWTFQIPIVKVLAQRVPATLILAISSILFTFLISIPAGLTTAFFKNSIFDKIINFLSYCALSVPHFFLALLLVFISARTGILPCCGSVTFWHDFLPFWDQVLDYLTHLITPVLVLSLSYSSHLIRTLRSYVLDFLDSEFIKTARAKGVSESCVLFKHVSRNAINPIVTSFGFALSDLLSGSLLVENILNYPGLGQIIYEAFLRQDKYLVMASIVVSCVMLTIGNLIADIVLMIIDPRIRSQKMS